MKGTSTRVERWPPRCDVVVSPVLRSRAAPPLAALKAAGVAYTKESGMAETSSSERREHGSDLSIRAQRHAGSAFGASALTQCPLSSRDGGPFVHTPD